MQVMTRTGRVCRGLDLKARLSGFRNLRPWLPVSSLESQIPKLCCVHTSSEGTTTTSSPRKLEGRVAVITGAANGIGASCARLLHEHGARVYIADVDDEAGEKLSEELGPSAHFFHCDVANEKDISGVIDLAVRQYGKLDILHNNAGMGGRTTSIVDIDINDFDKIYAINVRSTVLGLKHAARVMIPRKTGSIISTCSVAGVIGGAAPSPYAFTKSAIPGMTRQAAAELGKYGIRVNCISPSGVPSYSQLRKVRMVKGYENLSFEEYSAMMDEISDLRGAKLRADVCARSVLFLASDDASFTSGQNFLLDGGFACSKIYPLRVLTQTFDSNKKSKSTTSSGSADDTVRV